MSVITLDLIEVLSISTIEYAATSKKRSRLPVKLKARVHTKNSVAVILIITLDEIVSTEFVELTNKCLSFV